jgi:hypothetical protein
VSDEASGDALVEVLVGVWGGPLLVEVLDSAWGLESCGKCDHGGFHCSPRRTCTLSGSRTDRLWFPCGSKCHPYCGRSGVILRRTGVVWAQESGGLLGDALVYV